MQFVNIDNRHKHFLFTICRYDEELANKTLEYFCVGDLLGQYLVVCGKSLVECVFILVIIVMSQNLSKLIFKHQKYNNNNCLLNNDI